MLKHRVHKILIVRVYVRALCLVSLGRELLDARLHAMFRRVSNYKNGYSMGVSAIEVCLGPCTLSTEELETAMSW